MGHGDIYPITVGGRIFTFVILILGLGVVAVPTGLISSALTSTIAAEQQAERLAILRDEEDRPSFDPR